MNIKVKLPSPKLVGKHHFLPGVVTLQVFIIWPLLLGLEFLDGWPFRCLGLPSNWDKLRIWKHQPELDSWLASGFRKKCRPQLCIKLKAPYKDASRTWMRKQGETMIPGDAGFLTLGVSLMSFTPLHAPTKCFDFLYMYIFVLFGAGFLQKKVPRILPEECLNMKVDVRVHQKTQNSHNLTPNRLTHIAVHT